MRFPTLFGLFLGFFLGSIVTYFAVNKSPSKHSEMSSASASSSDERVEPVDEFDSASFDEGSFNAVEDLTWKEFDVTLPSERDMVVSMWYSDMKTIATKLEARTGHVFEDVWKGRTFSEILTEHAEFMEEFAKETHTISAKRAAERSNTSEEREERSF